jgi:hypothetical protein
MFALHDVQRAMRAQLLAAAPDGGGDPALVDAAVMGDAGSIALRMNIYRNTCLSTLCNALRLSFPAVQRLVGADYFQAAAYAYIGKQPPTSACLDDYGSGFADFLRGFTGVESISYLPDVARLEWAITRALHAEDAAGLDLARLAEQAATSARLRLRAHPSLSLLQLPTPADSVWSAVLEQDEAAMAALDLSQGPVHLLVERMAGQLHVRRMSAAAWNFTQRLCAGEPLDSVIAPSAADAGADVLSPPQLQALLAEHLSSGRFIDFDIAVTSAAGANHS